MAADYDSPWKEALDAYFEPFLALLFPAVHRQIDWSRGFEALDKEFQQVVREAEVGRRYVDKLVKVWTKDGAERWVLIDVEVQTTAEGGFPLRMYVYNYRIFDRYNRQVASLAVLADDDPNWQPGDFRYELFGCEVGLRFPVVKLLDFAAREAELEASANPFAHLVLAHLKALQSHGNPADRFDWKLRLMCGLRKRGLPPQVVVDLLRLIDWLMELPPELTEQLKQAVNRIEEEERMPFVTSFERVARCQALRKGIEAVLRIRFSKEGLTLMPEIQVIYDGDKLEAILDAAETVDSPDTLRKMWTPATA